MTDTNPGFTNYSAKEAVARANSYGTWQTNMCMNFTWYQLSYAHTYGIPDANAGWEMAHKTHTDRNPPAGAPVYWRTSHPYGHVALSVGGGKCRSTDWPSKGKVGTVDIDEITTAWGMTWRGWAEDLCGDEIEGLLEEDDDVVSDSDIKAIADAVYAKLGPESKETNDRVMGGLSSDLNNVDANTRETNDRVMAVLRERYYVTDDNGVATSVPKGTEGSTYTKVLDTLDGNSLTKKLDRIITNTAPDTSTQSAGFPVGWAALIAVLGMILGAAIALGIVAL
jgi:hypothetical protein